MNKPPQDQLALILRVTEGSAAGETLKQIAEEEGKKVSWLSELKQIGEKASPRWLKAIAEGKIVASSCLPLTHIKKVDQNRLHKELAPPKGEKYDRKAIYLACCEIRGIKPRVTKASAIAHFEGMSPTKKVTAKQIVAYLKGA